MTDPTEIARRCAGELLSPRTLDENGVVIRVSRESLTPIILNAIHTALDPVVKERDELKERNDTQKAMIDDLREEVRLLDPHDDGSETIEQLRKERDELAKQLEQLKWLDEERRSAMHNEFIKRDETIAQLHAELASVLEKAASFPRAILLLDGVHDKAHAAALTGKPIEYPEALSISAWANEAKFIIQQAQAALAASGEGK